MICILILNVNNCIQCVLKKQKLTAVFNAFKECNKVLKRFDKCYWKSFGLKVCVEKLWTNAIAQVYTSSFLRVAVRCCCLWDASGDMFQSLRQEKGGLSGRAQDHPIAYNNLHALIATLYGHWASSGICFPRDHSVCRSSNLSAKFCYPPPPTPII